MKNRKGFTIVELVIVIAVIAILAAVLIPTFSSVTASARASAAQQQAKAGLDSILALTEGSLPEGTLFCVTNSDDQSLNYTFIYGGNKLTQADAADAATKPEYYITTGNGTYAIYVTASAFTSSSNEAEQTAATNNRTKVENLILNVLKTKDAKLSTATKVTINTASLAGNGGKFYTATATAGDAAIADAPAINVYYTADIQETMVVFIGNDND